MTSRYKLEFPAWYVRAHYCKFPANECARVRMVTVSMKIWCGSKGYWMVSSRWLTPLHFALAVKYESGIRYPRRACLFAFRLMPHLLGLFHWGVCRVSKLGAMSKIKSCKIDRIVWKVHGMSCFVFCFCERNPLPIHCTDLLQNKTSCWISSSGAILEIYFLTLPVI